MNILVNGANQTCPQDANLSQLLATLDIHNKKFALELNKEVIPRSEYDSQALHEGDTIEIIQAIGGG